ncbi:polynucleotide adenylyltransferase [Romboutsia sp. 1001216sp1]|uniref:CCA tRNA nucleotidyltransferase n=1 Tax=unclassified Romboutsia TaxID=2626894 RepID=UPI00189DC2CE|nr:MULTISPECIES: polynucleotide adenylyltransferase [unclassified Romboutsia]MDB8789733.1 polynucleotide adenylyltransferase [Romboutsia sp. 1001216sp1]MDB8792928.1 polynucleotide adenylyltransferase [Romboutsia sp. 1001216sp1]MDB8795270.1 polynucleotide adenylyltransferase [Romboutsia sp. 1001216sp1]MDB8799079.1 polynucleotide adenylyltransferase [Romboutsia sp. 1001216sp1]MDB8801881.1 polynucleotide adenylyltransferase [Romboutsia sp. 1001216sp1]
MYINLPKSVKFIIEKIKEHGEEAYIVGGCVRDSILGILPNDYDITTSAKPNKIIDIFKGYKIIENGIKHGTVGILIEDEVYEITTYRVEGEYEDNRRPKNVEFTSKLVDDLKRRDFTINAMAYNEEDKLIDYFDGVKDLHDKKIRTVGNPDERFIEDGLRIIRAIRFSSKLGFDIEKETFESIKRNSSILKNISRERVSDEIKKIILSENPQKLGLLYSLNIFKELEIYSHVENYEDFCTKLTILKECNISLEQRLLMIEFLILENNTKRLNKTKEKIEFYNKNIRKNNIVSKLKYPNNVTKYINNMIDYMLIDNIDLDKIDIKKILNKIGIDNLKDILKLKEIYYKKVGDCEEIEELSIRKHSIDKYTEFIEEIAKNNECYKINDLDINGNDLRLMGYSGKSIGEQLNLLLEIVICNPEKNSKSELMNLSRLNKID